MILALAVGAGCGAPPAKSAVSAPTARLPSVELQTLDGRAERLSDALAGRPALVSLWATWCDACAAELPALSRLSARAPALGAVVVAVAVGEPREKVAAYVRASGIGWLELVDEQFQLADALGQRRVPATLVIDRAGRITYAGGALDAPALAALRAALDGRVARR